jgi:4-hydroxy-3-polyprenylbenzoate decarboxylase
MRTIVGFTGASGVVYGVDFLRRCPGNKYLIASKWGRRVLQDELGLKAEELLPWVKDIYNDNDLGAPFSSGSNHFDTLVIVPCSISTLAKIANGIADTLITRIAQVALKERRRLVIALRETPLSSIALENALKLSREGAIIAPVCPPHYMGAENVDQLIKGYGDKLLNLIGVDTENGWRHEELE